MDADLLIPGPRTKAAMALLERHHRRRAKLQRRAKPKVKTMQPDPSQPVHSAPRSAGRLFAASIGDASRRLGLSLRAIRLYEEMGLITCGRGPNNSRVLDAAAQDRLRAIIDLKALGLPISEIAELLPAHAENPGRLRDRIEARLAAIEQQRTAIVAYLSRLPQAAAT